MRKLLILLAVTAIGTVAAPSQSALARATQLTVNVPAKVAVTHSYEWVPWSIGGPDVAYLDYSEVWLENFRTRNTVDLVWTEAPDNPSGVFQVYDDEFEPGLQQVRLSLTTDTSGNRMNSTSAYVSIKMGSRPHLSLSSAEGRDATTLYASGTRWSGYWHDWVPSNAVARIEKLQGSTWVNVAHKTLYHGHATITVPGHGTYRELILETDGVWGSHSHAKTS
jgi:hypothetical protein